MLDMLQGTVVESVQYHTFWKTSGKAPLKASSTLRPKNATDVLGRGIRRVHGLHPRFTDHQDKAYMFVSGLMPLVCPGHRIRSLIRRKVRAAKST